MTIVLFLYFVNRDGNHSLLVSSQCSIWPKSEKNKSSFVNGNLFKLRKVEMSQFFEGAGQLLADRWVVQKQYMQSEHLDIVILLM